MNSEEVFHEIKNIIKEVSNRESLGITEDFEITRDTVLIGHVGESQLKISSIDYIEIIVKIEEQFDIEFDFEVKLMTVGDWIDFVSFKSNKKIENEDLKDSLLSID